MGTPAVVRSHTNHFGDLFNGGSSFQSEDRIQDLVIDSSVNSFSNQQVTDKFNSTNKLLL